MSWEAEPKPLPTRAEELALIEGVKDSFRRQSLLDLTQNDALRLRITDYRKQHTAPHNRSWRRNFVVGSVLAAVVLVPVSFALNTNRLGVPTHFTPKLYVSPLSLHPHFYRRWKQLLFLAPAVLGCGLLFACARTSIRPHADEFLTARGPLLPRSA